MLSINGLRNEYRFIRMLEQSGDTKTNGALKRFLDDEKRELRKFLRDQEEQSAGRRIVKDNGFDGYLLLMELPECLETYEEADEYFRENEYIRPYYTYYDCTGRPFTSWYKLFLRHGRWYAYHSVCFDV